MTAMNASRLTMHQARALLDTRALSAQELTRAGRNTGSGPGRGG